MPSIWKKFFAPWRQLAIVSSSPSRDGGCAVWAWNADENQMIRLLDHEGKPYQHASAFHPGQIWLAQLTAPDRQPDPFAQDRIVLGRQRQASLPSLKSYLVPIAPIAQGPPDTLLEGKLQIDRSGKPFVLSSAAPDDMSLLWIAEGASLRLGRTEKGAPYYEWEGETDLPSWPAAWLAQDELPERIPSGALLHLAFDDPWRPEPEKPARAYLYIRGMIEA
ncbi:hypothetical protein JXA32_03770 [Candidatus Sumerlaeota bacterium]|nr:hypothetical protein [Candidatus Sumerlaeota bacterium]